MRHRRLAVKRRIGKLLLGLTLIPITRARAVSVSPIYGLQVLGGQYFYSGQKSSLSGNLNGLVAPGIEIDENWSLLPSLNTIYSGTNQVIDIVGSGTLFQEQWDNRAAVTVIYTPTESLWRLKPTGSFKYQMLKETKGANWGGDVFDYYKWSAGLEAEYVYRDPFTVRFGADYYELNFPNYTSLESQAALQSGGQDLARELVGDSVLNTSNASAYAAMDGQVLPWLIVQGSLAGNYQRFPKQRVVNGQGALIAKLREDVTTTGSAGVKLPYQFASGTRLLGGFDAAFSYNTSNQNSFDATQTQFLPFYYNYVEARLTPSVKVMLGNPKFPVTVSESFTWYGRRYPYRLTQDNTGLYQGSTIHTSNYMSSTSLTYPMARHFNLLFNFQYGQATSNMHYEQFFKYNYTVTNYFFGFNYDY